MKTVHLIKTPDPETGIGAWTDGENISVIREGISKDGPHPSHSESTNAETEPRP